MKKRVQKISSFSLAIVLASSLLALQPTRAFATANVTSPTISVNANKNVDVALAVGKTSVDYSDFETQLKEAIGNKIPGSNINIMAATSVDTSTSSDFDWMEFDHSYNSATYSSINDFVDQTKETNGNAYNTIDRHVVLDTTNGTKLTFRGYGSHAYSDFMLLENDQTTNKTFQFDIKEYFAADALYNIGFFFNSNLTYDTTTYSDSFAAYQADKLYLNGYLMALSYNGNSTTGIGIYKVNNLPLNSYHNDSLSIYGDVANDTTHFTRVAHLNQSSSSAYKASDDLRKFRVEVTPTTVAVYYAGFDDTSHSVSMVYSEDAATSFDPTNAGYVAFSSTNFKDLSALTFTNDVDSSTASAITLDTKSGGSDFGPMVKYGSHGCGRLTKVELSGLTMATDVVRTLNEVIREPKWQEDSTKLLVNLNEDPILDFDDDVLTGELLNRLQNEDIYYVGWCSDKNVDKSQEFLQKNDLKGILVNVDDTNVPTIQDQIAKIADEVVTRYNDESGTTTDGDATVVTKGSDVVLGVSGASDTNTADAQYPDGKWIVKYYDTKGDFTSQKTMSDLNPDFTNAGTYKIYYEGTDAANLIKTIIVNQAPVSEFTVQVATAGAITANLTDTSNDLEGSTLTTEWKYRDVATGSAITITPDADQKIKFTMNQGNIYLVSLTVTDKWGASSTVTKQVSYDPANTAPPVADFTLSANKIVSNASGEAINGSSILITDKSYDVYGKAITSTFKAATGEAFTIIPVTGQEGSYRIDTSKLKAGTYTVYLTVNNGITTSKQVARFFTIEVDDHVPVVSVTPDKGDLTPASAAAIHFEFSDTTSKNIEHKIIVTTSDTEPTAEEWSKYSFRTAKTEDISLDGKEGTFYIHYLVKNDVNNQVISFVGPYQVDTKAPSTTNISSPGNGKNDVAVAPVISFKASESVVKGDGYLYIKKASDNTTVYSIAASNPAVRINGDTITVEPMVSLENDTSYYISLTKNFVKDAKGNAMPAMDGKSEWTFKTKKATDSVETKEIKIIGVSVTQKIDDGKGGTESTTTKARAGAAENTFVVNAYQTSDSDATIHLTVAANYSVTPDKDEISISQGSADITYTKNEDGSYDVAIPSSVAASDRTVTITVKGQDYTIRIDSLGAKWKNVSSSVEASGIGAYASKSNLENAVDISDVTSTKNDVKVDIKLIASADVSKINAADMSTISSSIKGSLKFVDIKVVKSVTVDSGTPTESLVHNTLVPIKIRLTLPSELQGGGYKIDVYRIHNDVISKLDATLVNNGKEVEFESDEYSTYALKYEAVGGAVVKANETVAEEPVSFEKTNPKDVKIPLTNKNAIKEVIFGDQVLAKDSYEIKGGNLIIDKKILGALTDGNYTVKVTFGDNAEVIYTVNVKAFDASSTITDVPIFYMSKSMSVGNTFSLTLTGVEVNADVVYSSSNDKIVTISKDGRLKAKKNGTATVTATITQNGAQYKLEIKVKVRKGLPYNSTVKDEDAISVDTSLPVFNIYKRLAVRNKTALSFKNLSKDAKVSYSSDNTGVASVSKTGVIKGIASGECVITVKVKQNNKTFSYKVLVLVP